MTQNSKIMGAESSLESALRNPETEPQISLSVSRMIPLGVRPPLRGYLREIWGMRYFVTSQAKYRSLSGSRGTLLGRIWLLLEPFLRVAMYYVVFAWMLHTSRGTGNFIAFLAIGVILFTPMLGALTGGSTLIERNRAMIRGFSFPRATLVLSDNLRSLYDSVPEIIALLLFIWIFPTHEVPHLTWFALLPILLLRQCFVLGTTFFAARLGNSIPDMRLVWPLTTRFWFYASGVFFSIDHLATDRVVHRLLTLNPAYLVLDMSRSILMYDTVPRLSQWLELTGWSTLVLIVGFIYFWRGEVEYNRVR